MEISHAVADTVAQMAEDNHVRYVKWESCTKREQEMAGVRTDPVWKPDSAGVVKESRVPEPLRALVNDNLLLSYALKRRSLTFDQARLIDYMVSEKWSNIMLECLTSDPPKGYAPVSHR